MRKTLTFVLLPIFIALFFYIGLPTFQFGYHGLPLLIALCLNIINYGFQSSGRSNKTILAISFTFLVLYFFTVAFSTFPIFRSEAYQNLIGKVKIGQDFSEHMAPISTDEIVIVDKSIAYRLGDKVMGSVPSLGSQTELGHFTLQKIGQKLYWIAPLVHSGFFKWLSNLDGTGGYIKVSATNERDVELVQSVNGKPIQIKYQPNAYFSSDLARHLYLNGFMDVGFTDFTFETDDAGNPFWVITLYDKKIGFSGKNAIGIATVEPTSGKIERYDIKDAPKWVDRIQPADFIIEQLNDWGEYVHGFWNPSNKDKLQATNGITLVYGPNNEAYWYTGLTSVGKDEGTVGFALINTRTKQTFWYKHIGATEEAAQQSAMGKVQEKGYEATFPATYNINGIPTYVMSLKDQAGLVKMVSMVSVEDYTIVGVGSTIKECLRSYKNILNSNSDINITSEAVHSKVSGAVTRFAADVRDGNTFYYLKLNSSSKTFVGTSLLSSDIIMTQKSDSVTITYDDDATQIIDIIDFDNSSIK